MARALISRQQNHMFDNRNLAGANWGVIAGATRTGGQPDPMGGAQACLISETAGFGVHWIYNSGSPINIPGPAQGRWLCISGYLAPGTRGFGGFVLDGGASWSATAFWNLSTGASTLLSTSGRLEKASVTLIESDSLGFKRYQLAFYALESPATIFGIIAMSSDGTSVAYVGDPTQNIVAYAPGFAYANQAGEITDTTAAIITTPIRNRVAIAH